MRDGKLLGRVLSQEGADASSDLRILVRVLRGRPHFTVCSQINTREIGLGRN